MKESMVLFMCGNAWLIAAVFADGFGYKLMCAILGIPLILASGAATKAER